MAEQVAKAAVLEAVEVGIKSVRPLLEIFRGDTTVHRERLKVPVKMMCELNRIYRGLT